MESNWRAAGLICTLLLLCTAIHAGVQRKLYNTASAYLVVEILDDDLLHIEYAAGPAPVLDQPLYTSPMVFKNDYSGPSNYSDRNTQLETRDMLLDVQANSLCISVRDRNKQNAYLTTLCPANLDQAFKGINIDPGRIQNLYGLGQEFKNQGSADGDWITHKVREGVGELGNGFVGFQNAAVGNVQIPVLYAVGPNHLNYTLFADNVYKQKWDFSVDWWQARMYGDQLRFYLMTGPDLVDLRGDYLELTGTPPVPPKKAFGLWVSEFGYDNWGQLDTLLTGLRDNGFAVDGFVLDLNWFGGIVLDQPQRSHMGRLDWDRSDQDGNGYHFPAPAQQIQQYHDDHIALAAIEESYLANSTDTFTEMPDQLSAYQRTNGKCNRLDQTNPVIDVTGFWGIGRMIDWSDIEAGSWIHDQRRHPNLVRNGIRVHWTDLGEPESFDASACYEGVETTATGRKNEHSDIHNLYNLMWNQSIWNAYFDDWNDNASYDQRPFILTRSGAAGTQRFATAMWSGDIASNLDSLASHFNSQLHMSFSGVDYYGADIGGFRREVMPYNDKKGSYRGYETELYSQWLANGAWFDIPVRPHTDNEFVQVQPPYQTSPHLVGDPVSNKANLQQRYRLTPYYYSLAYQAYLTGEPLIPPMVFHYQDDLNVRQIGHQKMIGRDLLVAVLASHGELVRNVYLPQGKWINYHTLDWFSGAGQWIENFPTYLDGILRLPVFARAGAILPMMHVDDQTKDVFGHRRDGTIRDELIVRVFADRTLSQFTLYEDDGSSHRFDDNARPVYQGRVTEISQRRADNWAALVINAASGTFDGATLQRNNKIQLVVDNERAKRIQLNGADLPQHTSAAAFEAAQSGWHNSRGNLIEIKSGVLDVSTSKTFVIALQASSAHTSVNLVCDNGWTAPGEEIHAVGNLSKLGGWDPNKGIPLDPNVYHEYIYNPPPNHNGPGPTTPKWSGFVDGLPVNTLLEWKCVKKTNDGQWQWEPGKNHTVRLPESGFSQTSYGVF